MDIQSTPEKQMLSTKRLVLCGMFASILCISAYLSTPTPLPMAPDELRHISNRIVIPGSGVLLDWNCMVFTWNCRIASIYWGRKRNRLFNRTLRRIYMGIPYCTSNPSTDSWQEL